ncbi:MAG TPA: hypothetical protein VK698_32250 [Kofleriaceae bacterium]|nr:hypothetical protein [Kofleriaceae bacterium]
MVLSLGLAACGDGGHTDTGLDPDRPLTDLAVDELERICRALYQTDLGLDQEQLDRWSCYVTAIGLREAFPLLFADCEGTARDCLADPGASTGSEDCDLDQEDADELPACAAEVSVGDIERCIDQMSERARDLADTLSCDIDPDLVLRLPSVCDEIDTRCPGLLDE